MKDLFKNGLILHHPLFSAGAGMCILLGISRRMDDAILGGCAVTLVLMVSSFFSALTLRFASAALQRTAVFIVTAGFSIIVLCFFAVWYPMAFGRIELYLTIIGVDTLVISTTLGAIKKTNPVYAAFEGLLIGIGFIVIAALCGALREYLGSNSFMGEKLSGAEGILPIARTVPGAFFTCALLCIVFRILDTRIIKGKST